MSAYAVTHTGKDQNGDIISIGNLSGGWVRRKEDAIRDIESGTREYYVPWRSGATPIRVADGLTAKYLRTDRDTTTRNNLDELPDC